MSCSWRAGRQNERLRQLSDPRDQLRQLWRNGNQVAAIPRSSPDFVQGRAKQFNVAPNIFHIGWVARVLLGRFLEVSGKLDNFVSLADLFQIDWIG